MAEAKGFKDRLTGTTYDLKDTTAREGVATNAEAIAALAETVPTVDDDLATAGAAADAKATGHRLGTLENGILTPSVNSETWERGSLDSASGTEGTANSRLRTPKIVYWPTGLIPDEGYKTEVFVYAANDTYLGVLQADGTLAKTVCWFNTPVDLRNVPGDYVRILLAIDVAGSSTAIDVSENVHLKVLGYADKTLSETGKAADAKVVGDAIAVAEAALAPTFSTSKAYTAGKYVWYDGKFYQFTTDHAAGPWNAAHAAVSDIASSVSKTDSLLFSDIYPAWEQGGISTSTGENSSAQAVNNSRRVRIAETIAVTATFDHLEVQSDLNAQIFVYSSPVVSMSNFIGAREIGQYDLTDLNGKYIRILLSKLDSTQNLTPEEVNGNTFISTINYLDGTLTQAHKAAEAKSVGDVIARDSALHNLLYSGTMLIGYAMTSTPSTATTPTANDVMNTSDYIAVKGGETIACHGFRRYWWFDSNKAVVSNSSTGNLTDKEVFDTVSGAKLLKVPQSAAYIRVTYKAKANEQGEADTDVYLYRPTAYDQFLYGNMFAGTGKKYVALGSSSVAGTYSEIGNPQSVGIDPNVSFVRWIAEYNGYSITNLGVGGMGWRNKSKASGGGRNAAETIDYYYQPEADPPVNEFADADIITLYFGTNDWKGQWGASDTDAGDGWVLGDMTSEAATDDTVIGAMKYTLEKLIEAAPQAQIIVVLPGNFKKLGNAKTGDESNPEIDVVDGISYAKVGNRYALGTHNIKGDTLADYHAAIKACAEYYGVRFVNAGEICAANLLNIDHMLGDGIHPTEEYYKMMGYSLAPFIK